MALFKKRKARVAKRKEKRVAKKVVRKAKKATKKVVRKTKKAAKKVVRKKVVKKVVQKVKDIASVPARAFAESTAEVIPTTGKKALKLAGRVAGGILTAGVGGGAQAGFSAAQKAASFSKQAIITDTVSAHRLVTTGFGAEKLAGLGVRTATRNFVGKTGTTGVNKIFSIAGKGVKTAINTKTTGQATKILGGTFSNKAMAAYGAWAGSVFLGRWGQAEAAEPITIPLRDALRQAQETGDWSLYEEYSKAAEEITNLSTWEKVGLWSPFAAIIGIQNKMKGVREGVKLLNAIAEKERTRQLTEETEEDKWIRVFAEQETRREEQKEEDEEYYAGAQLNSIWKILKPIFL